MTELQEQERLWREVMHILQPIFVNKQLIKIVFRKWLENENNPNFIIKKSAMIRRLLYRLLVNFLDFPPKFDNGRRQIKLLREDENPYLLLLD